MITYKVRLAGRIGRKRSEVVHADYFKIGDGNVLTFRNFNTDGPYPIFVKSYAPGVWQSVENADPIKQVV